MTNPWMYSTIALLLVLVIGWCLFGPAPTTILCALLADPDMIIRQNDTDPYREWIVTLAKMKKALLPWYWD